MTMMPEPTLSVAVVQADVVHGDPDANADVAIAALNSQDAQLTVFPEAFLTGYVYDSAEETRAAALPATHASLERIRMCCAATGRSAIVGFLESAPEAVYNTAAFFRPDGRVDMFRKVHIPFMGADRFVTGGNALPVFDLDGFRLGILVCYDLRPPEAARTLALRGADAIVLITNWPEGAETSADHICIARAAENRVHLLACNRVGTERGVRFLGRSKIINPAGKVVADSGDAPALLQANLEAALARQKHVVLRAGEYEIDIMGCRRPELYRAG
jgi:predicted amidohydrolase